MNYFGKILQTIDMTLFLLYTNISNQWRNALCAFIHLLDNAFRCDIVLVDVCLKSFLTISVTINPMEKLQDSITKRKCCLHHQEKSYTYYHSVAFQLFFSSQNPILLTWNWQFHFYFLSFYTRTYLLDFLFCLRMP